MTESLNSTHKIKDVLKVRATASDDQNVPIVIVLVGIQVIGHVIGVVEDVVAEREHGIIRLYSTTP